MESLQSYFDFAKENKIPILALNSEGKLSKRDDHACKILQNYHQKNTDTPVLVLFGELHIIPNKLPKQLLLSFKQQIRQTIVYQNIDEIYWNQVEDGTTHKIVKFNQNEFCIQTSPPWVKYESMVYWYENLMEDPEFDIHEYIIENGLKIFGSNTHDNFLLILNEIIKSLDLKIESDHLEDFNLYDHTSLEHIEDRIEALPLKNLKAFYQHLIEINQSFKMPGELDYYCSNYSINKISYLAGVHLFNIYLHQAGQGQLTILKARSLENKLLYFIFEHMYAYFFSKIFNPHRKCDLYIDLKERMAHKKATKKEKDLIIDCIGIIDNKVSVDQIAKRSNLNRMNDIGKIIGQFLGDYFYESITTRRIHNREQLEEDFLKVKVNISNFKRLKTFFLSDLSYKLQKKGFLMKIVIQRVKHAKVEVEGEITGEISKGLLLLVCLENGDDQTTIAKACKKILALRIFEDQDGKMNQNIQQVGGEILSVSQFTLSWDGKKEIDLALKIRCLQTWQD